MTLALRLTLLLLLLHPIGSGALRPAFAVLAAAGLVLPRLLRHPALWLALAALAAWRVVAAWPLADNHAYLLAYWCLALGLAQLTPDPPRLAAWNGRLLVGLAFAFATLAKLLSPDYLDGRFFRATLIEDRRLEGVTRTLGGVTPEALSSWRDFLWQHADGPALPRPAPPDPPRLLALAGTATWLTLGFEVAVALAFLLPLGRHTWLRHALLLLFCATAYAIAPVVGFGWLLLAMGVAQCEPGARRTRLAYLGVYGLLILYAHALRV